MLLKNARILNENFKLQNGDLRIEEEQIFEIGESLSPKAGEEISDCGGAYLLPGFVDLHTHGAMGYDHTDAEPEAEEIISHYLTRQGVTTYLPTLITHSEKQMKAAAEVIAEAAKTIPQIGGIYSEGPFFSEKYKGAQNPAYLRNPDVREFARLQEAADGLIRIISLAPELSGACEFIRTVTPRVRVSMGHTDADYNQACTAIQAGASELTHTYNAMRPLHHRTPNTIGAAIDSSCFCECICDGLHVHPAMIRLLYHAVGADRMVLISDSMRACGMPDGKYDLGGQEVFVKEHSARLSDGTIAGSCVNLTYCVKKSVSFGIPFEDAVKMASLTPARAAGIEKNIGSIQKGKYANLILCGSDLDPKQVWMHGKKCI